MEVRPPPYRILILPGGKQFLVSSWADASAVSI